MYHVLQGTCSETSWTEDPGAEAPRVSRGVCGPTFALVKMRCLALRVAWLLGSVYSGLAWFTASGQSSAHLKFHLFLPRSRAVNADVGLRKCASQEVSPHVYVSNFFTGPYVDDQAVRTEDIYIRKLVRMGASLFLFVLRAGGRAVVTEHEPA